MRTLARRPRDRSISRRSRGRETSGDFILASHRLAQERRIERLQKSPYDPVLSRNLVKGGAIGPWIDSLMLLSRSKTPCACPASTSLATADPVESRLRRHA